MKYLGHIRLINGKVKLYNIDRESNILVLVGEHLSGKTLLLKSIKDSDKYNIDYIPATHPSILMIEAYCQHQKDCDVLNQHLKDFFPDQEFVLTYNERNKDLFKAELNGIPIDIINSGVINLIYLLIQINFCPEKCLLIDDIETHLSFEVQKKLSAFIKEYYESNKDKEIIVTTHSPFILDSLIPYTVDINLYLSDPIHGD